MIKDYELKKAILLNEQDYCCASCGKPFKAGDKIELAHRLIKSKSNVKLYGLLVIDNIKNLAATHSNGHNGKACNDFQIINRATQPIKAHELVKEIQKDLK